MAGKFYKEHCIVTFILQIMSQFLSQGIRNQTKWTHKTPVQWSTCLTRRKGAALALGAIGLALFMLPLAASAGPSMPCQDPGEEEEVEAPGDFSACSTPACGSPGMGWGIAKYELLSNPQINCGFDAWISSCSNWNAKTWCRKQVFYAEGCDQPTLGEVTPSENKGCG